jgi:hypothetical protein
MNISAWVKTLIKVSLSAPPKIIVPAWREGGIFSTQSQVGT